MGENNIYVKAVINIMFAIIFALLCIFLLPKVLGFFMPFVIGWIIAMITNPLVKFMEKRIKIVRKHSSVIIIIGALGIVIVILYFGGMYLGKQIIMLVQDMPNIYAKLEVMLDSAADSLNGFYRMLPNGARDFLTNLDGNLNVYFKNFVTNLKTPTISDAGLFAKNVADVFFKSIITVLSSYFFIAERENLAIVVKKVMPISVQEKYKLVVNNFKLAVGGYFKAQFKIMIVVTVIIFIGLEILGVDYSFFIAFGTAFLDFLPVFGTGAVFWPWIAIVTLSGNYIEAIGLAVIYIICQVVRQILQPKMVGDSIGLSPLWTLFFMYVGYKVDGLIGLIIGIPIGMVLINFYKSGVFDPLINSVMILIRGVNNFRKL